MPSSPAAPPNVTTLSAHPTQLGKERARPCRRAVLSGNTRPGRKPRRAHTHGVDRGETPRAKHTSGVTGILLARVKGLEAKHTPPPLIPSIPLRSSENPLSDTLKGPSENPPQTPSKDPRKTLPSSGVSLAVCGAAMWHMVDVYLDDRPLCSMHVLRVCVVSNDLCFQCACWPQSAPDHEDLAYSTAPKNAWGRPET